VNPKGGMAQSEAQTAPNEVAELITVVIGRQLFGIPVGAVQDVFSPQSITYVPLAPREIGGVLNLRGQIVTVIDVRERLGFGARVANAPAMAVGIERAGESYGLLIDEVGEVLTLNATEFEQVPPTLDAKWRDVSNGVYRLQDSLVVMLDVDRLISIDRPMRAA
jgi:purine-binding chemotaxis protein CheW